MSVALRSKVEQRHDPWLSTVLLPLQSPFAGAVGLKLEPGAAYVNPTHEHFIISMIIGES